MPEENKKLNSAQQSAVEHTSGPLLIIAGAGTGKTSVITKRVEFLINQQLAQPEEILCLTFTEKAAREMEERIDKALPYGYTQMWITTFHSFCDRILREEALNIGLDPSYRLLSDTDIITLIQQHLYKFSLNYYRPLGNPQKFIGAMLQHISRLNDEDVTPQEYLTWANSYPDSQERDRYLELANFYQQYEQLKIEHSFMDFANLISHTLKLFRSRPAILANYQNRFKYILVDEYQDTNFAQNQLVNLLASAHKNLTVVADDDQAIYRWRGAAVSNVLQFRKTYPESKLIVLTQNYRSTQEILDKAYTLISFNNPDRLEISEKIDKHLKSINPDKGEPVKFLHFNKVDNEAEGVAKKILELTQSGQYQYSDIAILVRANAHAEPFIRSLSRLDIPHQFLGPTKLFHQPEVKDLVAYLQVLENIGDNISFFRVLSMPFFALPAKDLAALSSFSKKTGLDLFEASEVIVGRLPKPNSSAVLPQLHPDTILTLKQLLDILHAQLAVLTSQSAAQILLEFMHQTGIFKAIVDYREPFDHDKSQNIIKFFDKIKSYETIHPEAYVPQINSWLQLASEIGESPLAGEPEWLGQNAVSILTLHSSKGLEFPVVFLVNLVSQRFPSTSRKDLIPIPDELVKETNLPTGDFHLQEERRLMYVGITRAKQALFLTASDYYGDAKRAKKLSPFITETLGDQAVSGPMSSTDQLSLLDYQLTPKVVRPTHIPAPKIDYISYSQIQTFLDCPLHYKLKYLLKISTPTPPAASFGTTIHAALKQFYSTAGTQDILDIYQQVWTADGYQNKQQAAEYFLTGKKYLTDYVQHEYNPDVKTVKLEESFIAPIIDTTSRRLLKIGGKIDRVDILPDGGIEIIDYKTSDKPMDQKTADSALQLSFYALAASILPTSPFGQSPEKIKLTLYYFKDHQRVSTTRTTQQLLEAKNQIFSYVDQIETSDFACCGSLLCKTCEYKLLCDFASKDES